MTALEGPLAPSDPCASLRFADVLTDHCVLQRGAQVPVWGTGPEGRGIEVRFAGQVRRTVVRDGRWSITLDAMPAGGPSNCLSAASDPRPAGTRERTRTMSPSGSS